MKVEELEIGDVVYAARDIIDDGSMPESTIGQMLAKVGTRGVVVMRGHMEEDPNTDVFLIRFEDENLDLGRPIGCFVEDLMVGELSS